MMYIEDVVGDSLSVYCWRQSNGRLGHLHLGYMMVYIMLLETTLL
jgi:hypothetical protein